MGPLRRMVCHCLLLESSYGLVLVDSGFGLQDLGEAKKRLGRLMLRLGKPVLDPEETALKQVQNLGFHAHDVRHIVLTHLDVDHAGGISDFPEATIHVFGPEYIAAMAPATMIERLRYRQIQWAHSPTWQLHKVSPDRQWFDMECVANLRGLPPEILMVPLPGHTLGHCGVAVQTKGEAGQSQWLLHAGDAYFVRTSLESERPKVPFGVRFLERMMQVDEETRLYSLRKLRELATQIDVICSHDPKDLSRFVGR